MDEYGFLNGAGLYFLWNKIKSLFIKQGGEITKPIEVVSGGEVVLNGGKISRGEDKKSVFGVSTVDGIEHVTFGDTDSIVNLNGKIMSPIYTTPDGISSIVTSDLLPGLKIKVSQDPPTEDDRSVITFVLK